MTNPRSPWKLKTLILGILALAALGAGAAAAWAVISDNPLQVKQKQLTAVTTRLKEIYPLSRVQTAEAVYSFVFPFDFFSDEAPWEILFGHRWSDMVKLPESDLNPLQKKVMELYRLGLSLGFNPRGGKKFIVVPVLVRAGVDFSSQVPQVQWSKSDRVLEVVLPPVRETDFLIMKEDKPGQDGFPEYPMTADQWKRLSQALEPAVRLILEHRGLYREAQENAQKVFTDLFQTAGLGPCRVTVP